MSGRATWAGFCALVAAISDVPFVPIPYGGIVLGLAAVVFGYLGVQDASHGMRGRGLALTAIVVAVVAMTYAVFEIVRSS